MARGARVLARNLAAWPGEIDLLVEAGGSIVAVEVKTRVAADPIDEMTDLKSERIRRTGMRLAARPHRYDLVTVRLTSTGAEVRWIPAVC